MEIDLSTVIASASASTVMAAIVSGAVSLWGKSLDYKNEYLKVVVEKRVAVYQNIESVVSSLKQSILDDDGRAFHMVFAYGDEYFMKANKKVMLVQAESMWVTEHTLALVGLISRLYTSIMFEYMDEKEEHLKVAGKRYYDELANLRDELEAAARKDIMKLYKLSELKRKKPRVSKFEQFLIPKRYKPKA